ncbi:unnamed protein product [Withania somnifera]
MATMTLSCCSIRRRKSVTLIVNKKIQKLTVAAASMSYHKQHAAAKNAASLAASLCQKVQKALLQADVQSKSDKSPVTLADYGSQAVVSVVLQKELGSASFSLVAEEDSGDLRKEEGKETLQRVMKVVNETLASDGTYGNAPLSEVDVLAAIDSGFLWGDQYAVALGFLDEGKVVLSFLACPNLPLSSLASHNPQDDQEKVGCLSYAQIGSGTYMQSLDGSTPIKLPSLVEAAHSLHDLSSLIAKKLGVRAPPVQIDSQAKYGALSRGEGAIYLRFPHKGYRKKIWDHAVGYLLLQGGVVSDAAGSPLDFSTGRYLDLHEGITVTNQKLMPALLKAVKESLNEKALSL